MTNLRKGQAPTASEVATVFIKMDKDFNKKIDESEFVSAIMEW